MTNNQQYAILQQNAVLAKLILNQIMRKGGRNMRNKVFLSVAIAAAMIITPALKARAFEAEKVNFGFYGAAAIPSDEDLETTGYIGGRLTYEFNDNLELGVESGYHEYKDEAGGIHFGDITGIPLLAIGSLKFPIEATDNALVPYLTGGVGVVFWDYQESSLVSDAGLDLGGDTSFSARAGIGLEYNLNDNLALFTEGSYLWSDYDVNLSLTGTTVGSTSVEMNTIFVGGGVKLNF